jgi:haloalkane dehalogenase
VTLAHREEGPADAPVALLLHGYPQSSYMWRDLMPAVAGAGRRAVAPDLAGFGDSEPDPPGTWERHVEAVERFRRELGIERCVLVVHDWGGLIGLRWACEHPDAVEALVISSSGFFPDGKWHGMAAALRTPGTGEQLVEGLDRDGFAAVLRTASTAFPHPAHAAEPRASGLGDDAIDEYWKAFADETRRRGQLELYRSGDFEKLAGYRLSDLAVPVLLVWGQSDEFAPVAGAHRFERELPDTELVVMDGAGHFVWEDAPERCAEAVTAFLHRIRGSVSPHPG